MAALKKKQKEIDLSPKDAFSETNFGRVVVWFLSTFRIMVMVVELVVVAAFLSRFWLDAKNADLSDDIKQRQAQIKAYKTTEKLFRDLQKRIGAFSLLISQPTISSNIDRISTQMPPTVSLVSLAFRDKKITIAGNVSNESELAQFITNLKSVQQFSKVTLSQFGPDQEKENSLKFIISLDTQNETELKESN